MKTLLRPAGSKRLWAVTLLIPVAAGAQSLPTASQVADKIAVGLNIGNTLEATGGETAWNNPLITQKLIDGVKAAGFNAVRLPCAWDGHADANTHQIDATWMARVKQVVDYCMNDGLYVVLNIHWDGGWLENHVTYADQTNVNAKQKAYWTQIATTFKGYDEHLLFAGTNEVHEDYNTPSSENIAVQQSYNQTFVDAVRATGGNNTTRPLVVQTYNTNIDYGLSDFSLPKDSASNRLIVEVHYYDPWSYTGSTDSNACLYWGSPYPAQSACSGEEESYVDSQFSKVNAKWVSQGIPVIIGEYGAGLRTTFNGQPLSGQVLSDYLASRRYYHKYVNTAAKKDGIKTFFWDTGDLMNRNTGAVTDQGNVDAILQGAGVGTSYALTVAKAGSGSVSSSPSGVSCGSICAASFSAGTSVTLTAVADGGSTFAGWSGACSGTAACTVSMSSAQNVTATFSATSPSGTTYTLRVTRAGSGSGAVSSSPSGLACGSTCAADFQAGTSVTLTAVADSGSTFAGWSGACSGTAACTVSMSSAQNVTATFNATSSSGTTYTLRVTRAGSGSGTVSSAPSGIACGSTCAADFQAGTSVTLTASPDGGSAFRSWSGACTGAGACTVSMTGAQGVTATFDSSAPVVGCATGGSSAGGLALLLPSCAALLRRRRRTRPATGE